MLFSRHKVEMVTPDEALPGRSTPIAVPDTHFVLGNPLQGPYPDGLEIAVFGAGCFWGVEHWMQMADGVDNETWQHHLQNGDYASWFRRAIKDEQLAAEAERIASMTSISPVESRTLLRAAIERDYTVPATGPPPVPGAS